MEQDWHSLINNFYGSSTRPILTNLVHMQARVPENIDHYFDNAATLVDKTIRRFSQDF